MGTAPPAFAPPSAETPPPAAGADAPVSRSRIHGSIVFAARRSMCVRLCDGFAFPIGIYRGAEDRDMHEASCRAQCPEAETALFLLPSGSDSIGDARDVDGDRDYTDLPHAFRYTKVLDRACRCHPPEGNRTMSLLRDLTLRKGDAVMTTSGIRVFKGSASFPYRPEDFTTLALSRGLKGDRLARLRALEQASLSSVLIRVSIRASQTKPASKLAVGAD